MGKWSTYARRQTQPKGAFSAAQAFLYFLTSGGSFNYFLQPPTPFQAFRFRVSRAGIAQSINLLGQRFLLPPGNAQVWIASNDAGLPGVRFGPILEVPCSAFLTSATNVFWFGPSVPLQLGVTYWLVAGCPGATPTQYLRLVARSAPLIPDALNATSPDGINWAAGIAGRSWNLRVSGQPAL